MATPPKLIFSDPSEIREFRKKIGMNQFQFWGRVGITQSGGSRYESGRNIPESIKLLLHLTYAPENRVTHVITALRAWRRAAS